MKGPAQDRTAAVFDTSKPGPYRHVAMYSSDTRFLFLPVVSLEATKHVMAQHRLAPLHACMQMNIIAFENACAGGQIQASMEKTYFDMWLRMMHELSDVWEDSYERLK